MNYENEQIIRRLEAYRSRLNSAVRTRDGDQENFIKLVADAMGSRSQRKFAEDIGVNVSSVSRILNGKVSEVSTPVLAKIAACADPNSGVTLEKLMEAQGIVEATDTNVIEKRFEDKCRRIIVDELLKRGYSISYPVGESYQNRYLCDFEFKTDALGSEGFRWLFETKMSPRYSSLSGCGRTRIWIDSAMAAYYRGEEIGRISLVVDMKPVFDQVKEWLSETLIKDEISVILINDSIIKDEYIAPMKDGRVSKFSLAKSETI